MYGSVRRYRIDPKNMDELVKRVPGAVDQLDRYLTSATIARTTR